MIISEPLIHRHFSYSSALRRTGRFFNYGYVTGDSVRQLIRDGFPREQITAFDINWEGISLGLVLYRYLEKKEEFAVISETFPFVDEKFDTVYTVSVIHVIAS